MAVSKDEVRRKEEYLNKIKNPNKGKQKKKKRLMLIIIAIIVFMLIALIFSVGFAFTQKGKNTIVKGVSVRGIELSNLTVEEAEQKIKSVLDAELNTPIKLVYEDFTFDLNMDELEFKYDIDATLEEAFALGRGNNIIGSNYEILGIMKNGKNLEMKYSLNDSALKSVIESINAGIPGRVTDATYSIEESELVITPGKDGLAIDENELKRVIIEALINRKDKKIDKGYEEIKIPVKKKIAADIDIEKIYEEIHCEPKDAYLKLEPFELVKDESGVDFAISMEDAKALITGDKEEYIIPLKITPAKKTVDDLGDEAFPHELASYKTTYDAGYTARSTNLKLAANKINGLVLLPGEEFSFNKVVGKRTVQDGYQNAPIYENGKVVDGLAGGICQISSTLYNAVLLANLEIVERRNHNFTSTYVPAGRDATVVYGSIDFKFKNSRTYPIKLVSSVSGGVARFEIRGIKEDKEYTVNIYTQQTADFPFSEEIQVDPSLAPGTKQVVQGGHNGLKVSSYRALVLDGKEISRTLLASDTYKVMNRVVKVSAEQSTTSVTTPVVDDLPTTETVKPNSAPNVQTPEQELGINVTPTKAPSSSTNKNTSTTTTNNKPNTQTTPTKTQQNQNPVATPSKAQPTAPVSTPTPEPTVSATPEPTPEPTVIATPEPTPEPTVESQPTSEPIVSDEGGEEGNGE